MFGTIYATRYLPKLCDDTRVYLKVTATVEETDQFFTAKKMCEIEAPPVSIDVCMIGIL